MGVVETEEFYFGVGYVNTFIDSTLATGSYIVKLDKSGEVVDTYPFIDSTFQITHEFSRPGLQLLEDDNLLMTGIDVKGEVISPFLMKLNQEGEIIFKVILDSEYGGQSRDFNQAHVVFENGDIIVSTVCVRDDKEDNPFFDICLFKLDKDGGIKWHKILQDPNHGERVTKMQLLPNGNVVLFGGKNKPAITPQGWLTITEIDSSGQMLSQYKSATDKVGINNEGIRETNGDMIIASSEEIPIGGTPWYDPFLIKLDKEHRVLWKFFLRDSTKEDASPNNSFRDLIELEEPAEYLAAGGYHIGWPDNPNQDFSDNYGLLLKFNTNGKVIWQRNHQFFLDEVYADQHFFRQVIQTKDGGFLACGQTEDRDNSPSGDPIIQFSWFVKTDEYGCLVPGCQDLVNIAETTASKTAFKIYPNPVADILYASFSTELNIKQGAQLHISSNSGQLIKTYDISHQESNLSIDVSSLPQGSYFVSIVVDGVVVVTELMVKVN